MRKSTKTISYNHNFVNESAKRVLQVTTVDPLGITTEETMDTMGRVAKLVKYDQMNSILTKKEIYYNKAGEKSDEINFANDQAVHNIHWEYDSMNRCTKVCEQEKETEYFYDRAGKLKNIFKPDGTLIEHSYNSLGQLQRMHSSDNSLDFYYSYDLNNNIKEVKNNKTERISRRTYDMYGNMLSEKLENGLLISFESDSLGRKRSLTLPDKRVISYSYFGFNLESISINNEYTHRYSYDLQGKVLNENTILGSNVEYKRNESGQIVSMESPYLSFNVPEGGYDMSGNIRSCKISGLFGEVENAYDFDGFYQLSSESGYFNRDYFYDNLENRVGVNDDIHEINSLNQIENDSYFQYQYDKNGNLISTEKAPENCSDDEEIFCKYDALGQLIEVQLGEKTLRFEYDAFGRRMFKKEFDAGRLKNNVKYLYDGNNEIAAYENDKLVEMRILGQNSYAVAMELNGNLYATQSDILGNVALLVDLETKLPAESYFYSAFGEGVILDSSYQEVQYSKVGNCWRFAGKRIDDETGLIYFGKRYYLPKIGRWISPDPIGFEDGHNLYVYVHNNPISNFDLYGTISFSFGGFFPNGGQFSASMSYSSPLSRLPNVNVNGFINPDAVESPLETVYRRLFQQSRVFDLRRPDLNTGSRMGFTNGINTDFKTTGRYAKTLSDMSGGYNMYNVYNDTHGKMMDSLETLGGRAGIGNDAVFRLRENWWDFYRQAGSEDKFLQIAHSQGALNVKLALTKMPEYVQQRIIVVTVAPAAIITRRLCYDAFNYVNKNDFIPRSDSIGMREGMKEGSVFFLTPPPGTKENVHSFLNPMYQKELKRHIKQFKKSYGGIR